MLELLGGEGEVLGLDIDIRAHNREAIENHPMFKRITMFEGDSTSVEMAARVHTFAKGKKRVMVCLDSNHTHSHVLRELEHYAPLVTAGSYCVVFDTGIEDMPDDLFSDRPWGKGNNPKTAVWEFLKSHDEFEIDKEMELKLLITAASDGWLKRVK
jgi:cephalosporin hydroxylase